MSMFPRPDQTYVPVLNLNLPTVPAKGYAQVERGFFHDVPIVVVTIYDSLTGGMLNRELTSPPLPETDLEAAAHCVMYTPPGVLAFRRGGDRPINRYLRVQPVPHPQPRLSDADSTAGPAAPQSSAGGHEGFRVSETPPSTFLPGAG